MSDRDEQGRLLPGHTVRPLRRGGPTEGELIAKHLEPKKVEVLNKLAELAAAGDPRSIELFLRYFSPGARQEGERIVVPGLADATTLEGKAAAIAQAVASGEITVEAGKTAMGLLELRTRVIEVADLARIVRRLEGKAPVIEMEDLA